MHMLCFVVTPGPEGSSVLCMRLCCALVGCLPRLADLYMSAAALLAEWCMVPTDAMSDCCSSSATCSTRRAALSCRCDSVCDTPDPVLSLLCYNAYKWLLNGSRLFLHALNQTVCPGHGSYRIGLLQLLHVKLSAFLAVHTQKACSQQRPRHQAVSDMRQMSDLPPIRAIAAMKTSGATANIGWSTSRSGLLLV